MSTMIAITNEEYQLLSGLIYNKFGINLGEKKRSLVVGRLHKILAKNGFGNFREYYEHVLADSSGKALSTMIDHISTNHTYFYREKVHYDFFMETILPEVMNQAKRKKDPSIRIWSAGCSSGEEPYNLGMLLLEFLGAEKQNWKTGILATDISERVLQKAINGVYNEGNVAHLPQKLKSRYMKKQPDQTWRVNEAVRDLILFRRLNLLREDYPFKQKFQVIFCRNVMIYFDPPTREKILRNFYRYSEPGSYLIIGHSESLGRANAYFKYVQPAVYKRVGD